MKETWRVTPEIIETMKQLRKQGLTALQISLKFGVVPSTVYYHTNDSTKESQKRRNKENEHKYAETRKKYRALPKNREASRLASIERRSTERGRLLGIYNSIKKRNNRWIKARDPRAVKLMSQENFISFFNTYVEKYGFVCFYYRTPLTFEAKKQNTLSVDRHDSSKGYTKNNIVFCGWAINNRKNAITIQDSIIFVTRYLEVEHPQELKLLTTLPGAVGDLLRKHARTNKIDDLKIQVSERMSFSRGGLVG